jgi:ABC-2 type transport system ATP-binding protein
MTPVLEIKNLRKVYDKDLFKKKQVVIDDLSCRFLEGQCTALMGHNGAGKTTTIRMIFGLIRPDQGEILFRGKALTLEDKRRIGYMPEINKLATNLTCHEILEHHLRIFRPDHLKPSEYKSAIEEKLREIQLWEHRNKKVGKLSKGMGRRLTWAQATIHRPELIILDEPMSGLDPLGHRLMANLINTLRRNRVSIILCTHELWSVAEICDNVQILNHGKLVFSTLDRTESQKTYPGSHSLTLSGVDASSLENLKNQERLPDWISIHSQSQSHNARIVLKDYADSVRWINACVQRGLLIIDFHKASLINEDNLVHYFGEEGRA